MRARSMYKVCFVTTISLTLKCFVLELAKLMHETGVFEIHFICDYDAEFENMLPKYIHYKPIPMKRGISLDGVRAIRKMIEYFRNEKFDMVQYSTPNASCYASIASKAAGIPCRLYCQWGIAYVGFKGIKRKIFKLVEKLICRNSTTIEPDSFGNLRFSHAEGLYDESKSCVIENGSACGVNLDKFNILHKLEWNQQIRTKLTIPNDAIVYIFIGRITRDKGINELFEATKNLMLYKNDLYLLLVGNMDRGETVNSDLYQWSKDEPRVIYCGYTDEVEKYLAASDVYILPSYREGFGTAVIEAEAMGVPVIVTDIPGPTDAMEKDSTGLIVKKGSQSDLYDAMEQMYNCKDMRTNMGENAHEFASRNFKQSKLFESIIENRLMLLRR